MLPRPRRGTDMTAAFPGVAFLVPLLRVKLCAGGRPVARPAVVTNWMGTLDPSRAELVTQAPGHLAHEGVGARLPAGGHP